MQGARARSEHTHTGWSTWFLSKHTRAQCCVSTRLPSAPPRPGSFKLSWGSIRPFPRGAEPRFMLVSDIDGTMIGSHGDPTQYASSRRFRWVCMSVDKG